MEQVKGASLGYRIVPYDPQGAHKDRDPSLQAFHLPIARGQPVLRLSTLDKNGAALPGGGRQIRVVGPARAGFVAPDPGPAAAGRDGGGADHPLAPHQRVKPAIPAIALQATSTSPISRPCGMHPGPASLPMG